MAPSWQLTFGKNWGPVVLGQPRPQVVEELTKAGMDVEDEQGEETIYLFDPEFELTFAAEEPANLLQIVIEDADLQVGGLPLLKTTLDQALLAVQINAFEEAFWRMEDEPSDSLPANIDPTAEKSPAPSPQQLIAEGTLWIPSLGLGLVMWKGIVSKVALRQPQDSPPAGVAPLTEQQLELAMQQELPKPPQPDAPPSLLSRLVRIFTTLIFLALGCFLGVSAIRHQKLWNEAPHAKGTLVAIEPNDPVKKADVYVIDYEDLEGKKHQARFTLADMYVPQAIGDTVDVVFLPSAPDQPLGPAKVKDITFTTFVPWGIGLMAVYVVTNAVLTILLKLIGR